MVSSLIDEDTKWWKANTIKALFLPFEANSILKIPLCYNLPDDELIWVGNKRGSFTVKSAYYIAAKIVDSSEEGESSIMDARSQLWKKMWHLKISAKVHIFAWRTCMNALPTMQNLKLRGVNTACFFPLCDKVPETLSHALLHYEHAKQNWACWQNYPMDLSLESQDILGIALNLLDKGTTHDLELFFIVAWTVWWNRNQATHDDMGSPPIQTWEIANRTLLDYTGANSISLSS